MVAVTGEAATVTGNLKFITGTASSGQRIDFSPMDAPFANGINTVLPRSARVTSDSNGDFTINVLQGSYRVAIEGLPVGFIRVPTGSSTYNINSLWACFVYLPDCLEFPDEPDTIWVLKSNSSTNLSWIPFSSSLEAGDGINISTNEDGTLSIASDTVAYTLIAGSNITLSTNGSQITLSSGPGITNNAAADFLTYWDGNSLESSPLKRLSAERLAFGGSLTWLTAGANDSVGIGTRALEASNSQTDVVAIGGRAMGDSPTAADYNVAIGASAGRFLSGHDSIIIGRKAAATEGGPTNSYNVLIGADIGQNGADITSSSATNSVSIGYAALNHGSNTATIGNTNVSTLYLGNNQVYPISLSSSLANPTAQVGLAAVNGSSTNAMRADGAPALDQGISPTWTGAHTLRPTGELRPAAKWGKHQCSPTARRF
jgi:hypothetical protein